ncbi:MAG: hypothetical protein HRT87_03065 [Legionellales bacterium]|nr:hypothetical protein [Legionellales bacterium]
MKYIYLFVLMCISFISYSSQNISANQSSADNLKVVANRDPKKENENEDKCKKGQILVTINNTSNDEMIFKDKTQNMEISVNPKTNKNICVFKGDIIEGYVKHVKIEDEYMPIKRLMDNAERMNIVIDFEGHINIDVKTSGNSGNISSKIDKGSCLKEEVLVIINNTSNDEMFFEDKTQKIQTTIQPKTNKTMCLHKGDLIDGYVRHVKIEKESMPIRHLMWYTEKVNIIIDSDGHIDVDVKTLPRIF